MKEFPVVILNDAINSVLGKIRSIDFQKGVTEGLDPQIESVETCGPAIDNATIIDCPIVSNERGYRRYVKVSVAFSQAYWLFCDIVLRWTDYYKLTQCCDIIPRNILRDCYTKYLVKYNPEFQYCGELLLDDKVTLACKLEERIYWIDKIFKSEITDSEKQRLSKYMEGGSITQKTNSMYTYGMAFALIHEFSHHSLNQDFTREATVQDEIDADEEAFWTVYCDLNNKEKSTAMYGILSMLVFLLFQNPQLEDDKAHPRPIERIFTYYDNIATDNSNYADLLCYALSVWRNYVGDKNFPNPHKTASETLTHIKNYLIEKEGLKG